MVRGGYRRRCTHSVSTGCFAVLVFCRMKRRSIDTRADKVFAPNTFAMFSRVATLDLVAKTTSFLPLATILLTENLTDVLMHAYACSTPKTFVYSRLMFFSNSRRRTGRFAKRASTMTVVPFWLAMTEVALNLPEVSNSSLVPLGTSWA